MAHGEVRSQDEGDRNRGGYLYRDEIKQLVRDETKDDFVSLHAKLDRISDVTRDGAQAALLSSAILHGVPEMGVRGAIPDLQDRMKELEVRERERDAVQDERHGVNTDRFAALEAGVRELKAGQGGIREFISACITRASGREAQADKDAADAKRHGAVWRLGTTVGALSIGAGGRWLWHLFPTVWAKLHAAMNALR